MGIRIPNNTMKIQTPGVGRLSPDLAGIAKNYVPVEDKETKKLILDGNKSAKGQRLRVYHSGKGRSKSGYVSLISALRNMGLNPEELRDQIYDVKVDGKRLEIQF